MGQDVYVLPEPLDLNFRQVNYFHYQYKNQNDDIQMVVRIPLYLNG